MGNSPGICPPAHGNHGVFHDRSPIIIESEQFHRTDAVKPWRIYPEELDARADGLVLTFRSALMRELANAHCLDDARAVWSMWPGYLDDPSSERLRRLLADRDIPLLFHRCSGHAYVPDLQRLVTAIAPRRVVPMHSFAPAAFSRYFERVACASDGEWWDA